MKTILITGSSRGLGYLAALAIAERGWRVFATMRKPEAGADLLAEAARRQVPPERIVISELDVDNQVSAATGVDRVLAQTAGRLDAVLLNAGVASAACFEDADDAEAQRVFDTNVFGALRVARLTLPALRASSGRLLAMSSDAGTYGTPGLSLYSASKFALEGWAESIALELAPLGVSVIILEPGNFKTDIWDAEFRQVPGSPYAGIAATISEAADKFAEQAGDPDKVTQVIIRALEARRPRLRYRVGSDAKAMFALRRVASDRTRLALLSRLLGLRRARTTSAPVTSPRAEPER